MPAVANLDYRIIDEHRPCPPLFHSQFGRRKSAVEVGNPGGTGHKIVNLLPEPFAECHEQVAFELHHLVCSVVYLKFEGTKLLRGEALGIDE